MKSPAQREDWINYAEELHLQGIFLPVTNLMDLRDEVQRVRLRITQIGDFGLRLLWKLLHLLVSIWYLCAGVVHALESHLISTGLLKHYEALNVDKLQCLAVVVESEDAHEIYEIVQLLQWLEAIGVKHLCLYDKEGILKESKEYIIERLTNAILFEEADEKDMPEDQKLMTLELASASDGKEAITKAANLLILRYMKLATAAAEVEDRVFTEAHMTEALKAIGCKGPDPDLLLVYGPARCHLGFPAWRIRYTEIVHMGPLKSMRYGSLIKAIYKFTMVQQNYGK
ncbi:hypothetical protein Tsubulata_007065 [Turnera subulata]|uniref:ditrans,polycis-polyprenyl diphosphate synthase [(2E,6E)-farnesyldiphosphate specific] n=1 Tax=Turnera subulata TaxID=218843 RepID=A0A9Q0JQH4_9ROSI|nr:hypothetical protein Tsubulata_007065 [Turnera subulata]